MAGFHSTKDTLEFAFGAAPVVITDTTAVVSAVVDLQGYESVTWAIITGTLADADATFGVTVAHGDAVDSESAPTTITDTGAAPDECLDPLEADASFTFAADNTVKTIAYAPGGGAGKRYARVTVTPAANSGNAPLAIVAVKKPYSYGS